MLFSFIKEKVKNNVQKIFYLDFSVNFQIEFRFTFSHVDLSNFISEFYGWFPFRFRSVSTKNDLSAILRLILL